MNCFELCWGDVAMSRSRLLTLLCVALICATLIGHGPNTAVAMPSHQIASRGQTLVERESDSQSILTLFPELKSLTAPLWVQEGLRAYYRTSAATVLWRAMVISTKTVMPRPTDVRSSNAR